MSFRREGIDLSLFELAPEAQTPIELVTVGPDGGPRYELYGDSVVTALAALDARMDEAVQNSAALFFGSGTLVGAEQREITMRARELALSLGGRSYSTRQSAGIGGARALRRRRSRTPAYPTRCSSAPAPAMPS